MVRSFQRTIKGLCDPKSRFWFRWAPRLLIISLLLSVGWMVSLIFIMNDRLGSLEDSMLAKSLQESQVLAMAHCVLIGSAIPMLLDVFLDFIELKLRKQATDEVTLVHFRIRALLLLSNIVVTIVYATALGNDVEMQSLAFMYALSSYIALMMQITTINATIMTLEIIPNTMLLAACIAQFIGPPLELIYLLSPSHVELLRIAFWINNVRDLLYTVSAFVWGRDLWRRHKRSRGKTIQMETTEFICIVYW